MNSRIVTYTEMLLRFILQADSNKKDKAEHPAEILWWSTNSGQTCGPRRPSKGNLIHM